MRHARLAGAGSAGGKLVYKAAGASASGWASLGGSSSNTSGSSSSSSAAASSAADELVLPEATNVGTMKVANDK